MRLEYPDYRTTVDTFGPGTWTWEKPVDATMVYVVCIGGGGGGGSGARGALGTIRNGGQGGQGGAYNTATLPVALLTDTVAIRVGAGGAGGPANTFDDNYGDFGSNALSTFFGDYVLAQGGNGGRGGTDFTFGFLNEDFANLSSLYSRTSGGANGAVPVAAQPAAGCVGGGGGGQITAGEVPTAGGAGSRPLASGSATDFTVAGPGANGSDSSGLVPAPGYSGGGGSSPGTAGGAGVNGGHGGKYGAGGGGGAGVTNGTVSGAGGNGGDGICVVVTFF